MPGHNIGVVKRRDHRHALLCYQMVYFDLCVILRLTDNPHFCAQRFNAINLILWNQLRHADDAAHAVFLRGMGQAAAMIAGRNADNAALLCRLGQGHDSVAGTAQFEAIGDLMMFKLEVNGGFAQPA